MDIDSESSPTISENYLAALDIGSNSFHFVFARLVDNNLQVLHAEKYRVKLAQGLNNEHILSDEAIERGVNVLAKLASTTAKLSAENFRVVATYTLRQAQNSEAFLRAAAKVFPFDIEIISGHEEARLIYQGVSHYTEPNGKRLVLDIGGGSTECIIGEDHNTHVLASLPMGCVNFQKYYFPDRTITEKAFQRAIKGAKNEIASIFKRFSKIGWNNCIGTSGTIKSIYNIINAKNEEPSPISLPQLNHIKKQLIEMKSFDDIALNGLKENRVEVICSGLAILIALFESLNIENLSFCPYSLREGVLNEQLDLIHYKDVRQRSVNSLASRFSVDSEQSEKVTNMALLLYKRCANDWDIASNHYQKLLMWAAQLHEVGNDINPSGYHKHGEYIIAHADIAGFNTEHQHALAWLVLSHRKKIQPPKHINLNTLSAKRLLKVCILLRLSVLLSQQRQLTEDIQPKIKIMHNTLNLYIGQEWLTARPLIKEALLDEQAIILEAGFGLEVIKE